MKKKNVCRHLTKFSAHRPCRKTIYAPEIDFHANFSVKSHSAVISRFFSGCKVDVILSDQDPQVHVQEAWSMADLLQDDGSAYTHVYPSGCQLDDSVF